MQAADPRNLNKHEKALLALAAASPVGRVSATRQKASGVRKVNALRALSHAGLVADRTVVMEEEWNAGRKREYLTVTVTITPAGREALAAATA